MSDTLIRSLRNGLCVEGDRCKVREANSGCHCAQIADYIEKLIAGTEGEKPEAWVYELAEWKNADGTYGGWSRRLSWYQPNVPDASIRNVRPLYPRPIAGDINSAPQ